MIDRVEASYRDPAGFVFLSNDRVYRGVTEFGRANWDAVKTSPAVLDLKESGAVIDFWPADDAPQTLDNVYEVLEHPRLPFVSYPYEWGFEALKAAALHHLAVQLALLEGDVSLSDASAYNVQFLGTRPIFVDVLSFQPYHEGDLWNGMRQFTDQFLSPLLLQAFTGVESNAIYRGAIEGIPAADLKRLVPFSKRLSWRFLKYITLPAAFSRLDIGKAEPKDSGKTRLSAGLPKAALRSMLKDLSAWISSLERRHRRTIWADYESSDSYDDDSVQAKRKIVQAFSAATRPRMLWDMGCNKGDYSFAALEAGASYVVGWESDANAVDEAFRRAAASDLAMTPLLVDLANPSPDQGWAQAERMGLSQRGPADAVMALALVHHLAIGRNVPLPRVGEWLTGLARTGLVEFVPKEDAQVQRMLANRDDVFPDYHRDAFLAGIAAKAHIEKTEIVSATGRELIWFTQPA
jgi:ribosomal protein L11 methylase PrmA